MTSQRNLRLKQLLLDAPVSVCIERAKFYTETHKETQGLHPSIRAAKALEKTLKNMSIFILDEDQIVGYRTSKPLGFIIPLERGEANLILRTFLRDKRNRYYYISREDRKLLLKELIPYWDGKTVLDKKIKLFKEHSLLYKGKMSLRKFLKAFGWGFLKNLSSAGGSGIKTSAIFTGARYLRQGLMSNSPNGICTVLDDQGHLVMGHNHLLQWGFGGIKLRALEILNRNRGITMQANGGTEITSGIGYNDLAKPSPSDIRFSKNTCSEDNNAFLEAVLICCDAAAQFIKRFALLAEDKAKKAVDKRRSAELIQISKICNNISYDPPKTFRDAIQLVWFNEIIGNISHGTGGILALGRPDQYLYPFYKDDMETGLINKAQVTELLEELMIKSGANLLGVPTTGSGDSKDFGNDHVAITLGGVDRNGDDATNELSYLFLEAFENIKGTTISFSIRVSPEISPSEWVERALHTYRVTNGAAFYNDDIIIEALQRNGVLLEDARDYAIVGCVEPAPQGNAFPITAGNTINLPSLFEMLLNNGETFLGAGLPPLQKFDSKSFKSWEELWNKFKELIKLGVAISVRCANLKDKVYAENYPNPFISMTLEGCLENALDMTQGGAKYNFNTLSTDGFVTVANSLVALKKVVFDDKELSLAEMIDILNMNFKNREDLRVKLLNKVPKFGNDDPYADSITQELMDVFCDEINSHSCYRTPGQFRPCLFTAGSHVLTGLLKSATPDGRKAGEPVSNSLSPSNGTEKNGPTAVFNSVAKLCNRKMGSGMSLNMRFLPLFLKSEEGCKKMTNLILSYFKNTGMHVQFNVIDQSILKDAQVHPQKYKDLVVRVSGYNAFFVNLDTGLQEDIMGRVQFG